MSGNGDTAQGWSSLRRLIPILLAVAAGYAIGSRSEVAGRFLAPFGRLYLSLLLKNKILLRGNGTGCCRATLWLLLQRRHLLFHLLLLDDC